MKFFFKILFIALTLFSCRAVNKNTGKNSQKEKAETQLQHKAESTEKKEQTSTADYTMKAEDFNLNIEPLGGVPAYFKIIRDGKKIEGETTGKMSIGNKKQDVKLQTKTITKTYTKIKTYTILKTYTIRETIYRPRTVAKDHYPYWQLIIGAVLFWELLKLLIRKTFKI